jgi:hypothetical protein
MFVLEDCMHKELSPGQLKITYEGKKLKCKTNKELTPLEGIIGQERAEKALKFAECLSFLNNPCFQRFLEARFIWN